MSFNEQRVRTAFDGVTPQWSSMKEEDHEEWETIMEMLHDDAIDEIQEKIDGILDITATEVLEEADWTELIRRLRVEYPYPDGECGRCGEDNNKGGTALWCDLCADCDEEEDEEDEEGGIPGMPQMSFVGRLLDAMADGSMTREEADRLCRERLAARG